MSTFWTRWREKRMGLSAEEYARFEFHDAWLKTHPYVAPTTPRELEIIAWAEREAYWAGNIGQIEGRAMTDRERLEWEVAKKREECKAAIAHEIEVMVGLGCNPKLAKETVWGGWGNDKGAVAKLGKEFHAMERELATLVAEESIPEPDQATVAVVEHDELDAAREIWGVQVEEAVAEARTPTPEVIPDFEQAPEAREASGNGWRYGLAPGHVKAAEVRAPVDEMAERRRRGRAEMEERDLAAAELHQKNRAGLAEFRQQVAVEPTPSPVETVVDGPALPSYYHLEHARPLVPSMVPELDLTSAAEAVAETLMWDEPEAQEAVTEAPEWEANQQHAVAQLSGLQEVADAEGWEPEPEAPAASSVGDILDELGATVSEMTPEERATFLADDGITNSAVRWRLADPAHEPILGPGAAITSEGLREEARQAEVEVQDRLHSEIEAARKVQEAEIEGREEVARRWAEYDGSPMTPDPAESAKVASRTRESDQLKAEQARRARKQETDPPSREPDPPGQEPQL
ncbi:MAG: hypothetical protein ACYCZN_13150 [Candidatus Dormibacteria bacterium]